MTQPKYDDPRDYNTTGMFTQTAPAEALIRYAAMLKEMGKIASVHNTTEDIREMIIVDGSSISRIITHFTPLEQSKSIRIESLFIIRPDIYDSAEFIVSHPDQFYNRRSAVPVGGYTEEQVQKKIEFISSVYEDAMTEGTKHVGRISSQPGLDSLEEKIEDPLDLLHIEVDTSRIDKKVLDEVRVSEKQVDLHTPNLNSSEKNVCNSLNNLVEDYLIGKDKKE